MHVHAHLRFAPALAAAWVAAAPVLAEVGAPAASVAAEPRVERIVKEDDHVRIEELRVRGMTQSIDVRSKAAGGVSHYQIRTGDGSDAARERHGAGRSAWRLFSF